MEFRKEAIRKAEQPFETVEAPIPYRVPYSVVGVLLALALTVFVLWCCFGSISEKVHGLGIIAGESPIEEITSPGNGLIIAIDVRRGDVVRRGQIIGRIFSYEDHQALLTAERRVEMFRRNHARAAEEFRELLAKEDAADIEQIKQIERSGKRYDEQIAWYRQHVTNVVQLCAKATISQVELRSTRDALDDRLNQRGVLDFQRLAVTSRRAPEDQKLKNTLRDHEESLDAAILECERTYREMLYRSRIISTAGGIVLGIVAATGDRVKVGDSLVRIQRQGDPGTHVVTTYFSAREARKLAVGMPAIVTPSTVRAERDGSLRGIVTAVEKNIDTRREMYCQFRNDTFVDRLIEFSENMPVRVLVQLICDPNRPGCYEWTGAGGRDIAIEPNTICTVSVAYRRYAPVALAFARVSRTSTGSGVREESAILDPPEKNTPVQ